MIAATTKQLGPCQVRSETDHPCLHRAAVEIWGIPFCEPCAREQEAYFAVGRFVSRAQGSALERGRARQEGHDRASRDAGWERFVREEMRELELRKDGQLAGVLDGMRGAPR